jgi:cytidine deaminase
VPDLPVPPDPPLEPRSAQAAPRLPVAPEEAVAVGADPSGAPDRAAPSRGAAVDWDGLRDAARAVCALAYAPYSGFGVGAAGLVSDGRVVSGCNVENASYGLTLCAECGLVAALAAGGGGRLVAVAVVDGRGAVLMPCGRCRQLLLEHGGPECLVDSAAGPRPLGDLLPDAFGPSDLER